MEAEGELSLFSMPLVLSFYMINNKNDINLFVNLFEIENLTVDS